MPNRPILVYLLLALICSPLTLWAGQVTQTLKFSYPLTGGGRFEINDANGSITISSWDQNEIGITATKEAENQSDLDAIRIDIKQEKDAIEVHTTYASPGRHSGSVSYQVSVPKDIGKLVAKTDNGSISANNVSGNVLMKSANGAISATNLKGPFSLDTTNGSIKAECADLAGDGNLRTVNGSITLALPRSIDALVDAGTTVGRISSNLPGHKRNKGIVGETLEAKLGAGSHRLEARTTNGSIRLEAR